MSFLTDRLVYNWRDWYKMFSVQALGVIAMLQGALAVLPYEALQAELPFTDTTYGQVLVALSIATAVIGGIGRIVDQKLA
jgi:hypothetical protein